MRNEITDPGDAAGLGESRAADHGETQGRR